MTNSDHIVYQGEDGYVWHQACQCPRCRQKYEQMVREQEASQADGEVNADT